MAHASWGPGWPSCQYKSMVPLTVDGIRFPGGVRSEIHELLTRLVRETRNRGYRFGTLADSSYGCWGFSCRAIANTNKPSNHSWGLAVDINAPSNPMKYPPVVTDMPDWMPDLWNAYGFRWGGDYASGKVDAMHYEFLGSVENAVWYTQLARQHRLGEVLEPIPVPPKFIYQEGDVAEQLSGKWLGNSYYVAVVQGLDNGLHSTWWDAANGNQVPFMHIGGGSIDGEFEVTPGPGQIDVIARSEEGSLLHWWFNGKWNGPQDWGGKIVKM